ncbi:MAG TPA: hypothetical protein PLH98_11505 [Ruminococcus flavefaciens]|nr:hypothetical protein [Ruminococcus flavefaciens]
MAEYWWRSWHGAPMDHKWSVVAARTGIKPGIVSAIAWALFDYASQQDERGTVDGFDVETYSVYSGFSEDEITSVIQSMTDKEIIVDGKLAKWDKRQPKSESEIERNREYRKKQAVAKSITEQKYQNCSTSQDVLQNDTDCYGLLHNATKKYIDTDTDTDTDKDINTCEIDKSISLAPVPEISEKVKIPKNKPEPEKQKKNPSDPDYWSFLKEKEPLGVAFYQATKLFPVGKQFGLWVKGFNALSEAGITPEVIPRAVKKMRDEGLTIKSPESILAIAREIMINAGKAKDGTQWTRA